MRVKPLKSCGPQGKTIAISERSKSNSITLHEMGDKRRELWRQKTRRFIPQVYSFPDREKSGDGAFRMIAIGAEYGVVHDEMESDWEQAADWQDGVSWVGMERNRSDCIAAHCQRRLGERASNCAGFGTATNQRHGPSTSCRANDFAASFRNGHCRDLAGDAAYCAGEPRFAHREQDQQRR
jgi:hypothetical protein